MLNQKNELLKHFLDIGASSEEYKKKIKLKATNLYSKTQN